MLLLSVLCDPVCTSPYPFTDGMDCTTPSEVRTGLKALKSVTNAPLGRERYPTAPREIGEGVQRGNVTAIDSQPVTLTESPSTKKTHTRDGTHV